MFGTTLNKPLDADTASILQAIPGAPADCPEGDNHFEQCAGNNLWYSDEIEALIYSQEGMGLSRVGIGCDGSYYDGECHLGFYDRLRIDEYSQELFNTITNFKEVFILDKSGKKIRAANQIEKGEKTFTGEYNGFSIPICEYIKEGRIGGAGSILQTDDGSSLTCSNDGGTYIVNAKTSADFFFPQLTGRLRVGE